MTQFCVFVCFLLAVPATVQSAPSKVKVCHKALAPSTGTQGINIAGDDSKTARFQLHFSEHEGSKGRRDSKLALKVRVSVASSHVTFTDATISIESTGSCGRGSVTYDSKHFFQVSQHNQTCPELYVTRMKRPMRELPALIWTPPACGCVYIRALVIEKGSAYYAEKENIDDGALAKVVCVKKASRQQRLDTLCGVLDRYLTSEIISGDYFLTRHNLKGKVTDTYQLDLAIKMRRSDARVCCQKQSTERHKCFDNVHWRRIDSFCGDGVPDIPFTDIRSGHMLKLGRQCCYILGEYRYSCFGNEDMSDQQLLGETALDYSLDETDPANDVAEFASDKDQDIISKLSPISFNISEQIHRKNSKVDKSSDQTVKAIDKKDDVTKGDTVVRKPHSPDKIMAVPDIPTVIEKNSINQHKMPEGKTDVATKLVTTEKKPHKTHKTSALKNKQNDLKSAAVPKKKEQIDRSKNGHGRTLPWGRRQHTRIDDDFLDEDLLGGRDPATLGGQSWLTHYSKMPTDSLDLRKIPPRANSRRISSVERRQKGRSRHEKGFEDQGALSVERSLNKIQKKLQRLKIKQHCCRAGAEAGGHVYGKFDRVWKECSHSSSKLLDRLDLAYGHKICKEQFKKCCLEMSVSGPSMTSQEFRDVEHKYQNVRQPVDDDATFDVKTNQDLYTDTVDSFDSDAELRYNSMRDIPDDGDFFDEEYNGPLRFDDVDNEITPNRGNMDSLYRDPNNDNPNKDILSITEGGGDDTNDDDDIADSEEDEDEQFERELGFSDEEAISGKKIPKTNNLPKSDSTANKEQSRQNTVTKKTNNEKKDMTGKKKDKEKDNAQDFDAQALQLINRPTLAKSKNTQRRRKQKHGSASRRSRSRSRSNRSSRRRSSRRSSRRGRRNSNERNNYRQNRIAARYQPFGAVAAKDSHEMAAINTRRMTGAMDSKELLEAYSHDDNTRQKKHRAAMTQASKERQRKRGQN